MAYGGDIWSTGAFAYESSLKDLLDSDNFTLEQLLAEDELLLELRGCHQRLISFFSTAESVTKLIYYIIRPKQATFENAGSLQEGATENDSSIFMMNGDHTPSITKEKEPGSWITEHITESRSPSKPANTTDVEVELMSIRYPYMACEIICCEIPSVIDMLVNGKVVFHGRDTAAHSTEIVTTSGSDDVEVVTSSTPSSNDNGQNLEATQTLKSAANLPPSKDYSNTILDLLFSVLYDNKQGELDDYRAGYFDKVLNVLFRRRPEELSMFLNTNGQYREPEGGSLMQAMLKHLYSHSIMQIAQRLLLPQKPTGKPATEDDDDSGNDDNNDQLILAGGDDTNEAQLHCDWSNSEVSLAILLDNLTGVALIESQDDEKRLDMSLNASEVLITIIQNSMLSSNIMLSLTQPDTVLRLVTAATVLPEGEQYFSPHESMLTSAMNVLENLILQLGGYGALGTMSLLPADDDPQNQIDLSDPIGTQVRSSISNDNPKPELTDTEQQLQKEHAAVVDDKNYEKDEMYDDDRHLIADLGSILKHLPFMLDNLYKLLRHPSTNSWKSPMQYLDNTAEPEQQLLGSSRLRIVRLLESLVLLGDQDVDEILIQQSLCLETCLDFFWQFEWCSMLHQSVANLLVHVFEGQNVRADMQEFFLYKCDLLGRLMNSFVGGDTDDTNNGNCIDYSTNRDKDKIESINQTASSLDVEMAAPSALTPSHLSDQILSTEPAQIEGMIVENLNDLNEEVREGNPTGVELLAAALLESGDMSRGSVNVSDPLPVSEDDVDVAMEQNVEHLSTEAVQLESRDASIVGNVSAFPVAQTFRNGYMGHVIIICQALVNAYMHDDDIPEDEQQNQLCYDEPELSSNQALAQRNDSYKQSDNGGNVDTYVGPKDDLGDPLRLLALVTNHPLSERWHEFVATTLAAENAIQSTALGGNQQVGTTDVMMLNPVHATRPGLIDEGYMMGDDGDGPPAPPTRGMLAGGDVIDMDENDLDIAANMMAGMTLSRGGRRRGVRPNRATTDDFSDENDDNESYGSGSGSADSEKSYNSGETSHEKSGYAFDDPLGKAGGLGIELGKLMQYKPTSNAEQQNNTEQDENGNKEDEGADDDDNDIHSSSSEEEEFSEHKRNDSEDVPVLDLFAGNFNFTTSDDSADDNYQHQPEITSPVVNQVEFEDFANFDDAVVSVEYTPPLVTTTSNSVGGKDELTTITNSNISNDYDDDFGPFASAATSTTAATTTATSEPPLQQQEQETPQQSFGFNIKEDDPFQLEPITSTEFEDAFGKTVDPIELLATDDGAIIDPFAIGDSAEPSLPLIPFLDGSKGEALAIEPAFPKPLHALFNESDEKQSILLVPTMEPNESSARPPTSIPVAEDVLS